MTSSINLSTDMTQRQLRNAINQWMQAHDYNLTAKIPGGPLNKAHANSATVNSNQQRQSSQLKEDAMTQINNMAEDLELQRRLQNMTQKLQQYYSTISNIMKKAHDTAMTIVSNIR